METWNMYMCAHSHLVFGFPLTKPNEAVFAMVTGSRSCFINTMSCFQDYKERGVSFLLGKQFSPGSLPN